MFGRTITYACILTLLISFVCSQHQFGCEEDFCAKKAKCDSFDCKNGRLIRNATICGCCHICVKQLALGAKCSPEIFSSIPDRECGPGLKCHEKESKCVHDTQCIKDQIEYDEQSKKGTLQFGKTRPDCDEFGFYKPVVCISDVLCYCVNKQGKRIFGTDLVTKQETMQCNCSRDFEEFPKTKSVDNFLRCLPNGDYDKLQCTEEWCYCMQDLSEGAGYSQKINKPLKSLQCYDETRHHEYDSLLRSKCLQARYKMQQEITKYEDKGITPVGIDLPQCDLDGTYAPVQCKKNKCYCVKKNGKRYGGYEIPRKDAKDMTCRCARERDMLFEEINKNKNMALFADFQCYQNGNYNVTQKVGSKVIFVSDMGFQLFRN